MNCEKSWIENFAIILGRMFLTGLLFGPLHHYFYGWMDRVLPKRNMGSVTKKILLDQIIMSPACIGCFIYTMGALEKKSLKSSTDELKEKFAEVYLVRNFASFILL